VRAYGLSTGPTSPTGRSIRPVFASILFFAVSLAPARADAVSDFYKSKPVTLIVSAGAGGGYDTVARTVARFLGRHLPGNPSVLVKNMAGAGGITAANFLYNAAEKDGSQIGLLQNNTPFAPIFDTKDVHYAPASFEWLGSPSVETSFLAVRTAAPVASLDDAKQHEVSVGAAGPNSTPAFYARLINHLFGTKLKVVGRYPGQTEALMAMDRGDIDGYADIQLDALLVTRADWLSDRKIRPLLYYGPAQPVELVGVPRVREALANEEDRVLVDAAFAPLAVGRPFAMPPGVPPELLAAMRKALAKTFADPEFQSESKRLGLGADAPQGGEQVAGVIRRVYGTTPQLLDRLRKLDKVPP
jgi:tripartite-type tricarboxylate transporter receptor subunit TctC